MLDEKRVKVARKDVAPIVRATFPNYKGRKFSVEPDETVTLSEVNSSGGTLTKYASCTIDGQPLGNLDRYRLMHPAENPAEGMRIPIPVGAALVERVFFCGQDLGIRIHVNPADMPRMLTSPAAARG